jgi:hypothetical protein
MNWCRIFTEIARKTELLKPATQAGGVRKSTYRPSGQHLKRASVLDRGSPVIPHVLKNTISH